MGKRNNSTRKYSIKKFRPCVESGLFRDITNRLPLHRRVLRDTSGSQELISVENRSELVSLQKMDLQTFQSFRHAKQVRQSRLWLTNKKTHPSGCLALLLIPNASLHTADYHNQPICTLPIFGMGPTNIHCASHYHYHYHYHYHPLYPNQE